MDRQDMELERVKGIRGAIGEIWYKILRATVCYWIGHLWYYSEYKHMKSKRGCFRCFKAETPQTSIEFFEKIVTMEQRAYDDLLEFVALSESGTSFTDATNPIYRDYPGEWGPLAKDLP